MDNRHLNEHPKNDLTPFLIMNKWQNGMNNSTHITIIDIKAAFHLMTMVWGHERFTVFRTEFGLYDCMVMRFGLTNAPAKFQ